MVQYRDVETLFIFFLLLTASPYNYFSDSSTAQPKKYRVENLPTLKKRPSHLMFILFVEKYATDTLIK